MRCQGRHPIRSTRSFRQETGALSGEERGVGGANAGRALDDGAGRMEDAARRRLGQDLCGQQHDLRRAPEQRLFSVLAQFFGPDAINNRLLLIETISFTTTPADMLESLTRIIADRSVGALFFRNYHLLDYELMGGAARAAIIAETAKRGMTPFLPPLVPFGSKQWPTLITQGPGPATIADLK